MSEAKYITDARALMSLPLAELANPEHLTPLSEFVDNLAAPCVTEALMSFVSTCYLLILFDIFRISTHMAQYRITRYYLISFPSIQYLLIVSLSVLVLLLAMSCSSFNIWRYLDAYNSICLP
ncbi:hypothetical protein PS880_05034 [Pseudomonas fluorescens]|uniref:Uncharacterized protein n=1 Tax=Pseudomonas fluorescens TaxID=294 RepID=A0A5E7P5Y6_PSEFL|nr:hypothetical protein PS880_05034 [Pseudomonas fluorescens]